jgi:cell division protein FtsQ
VSTQRATFERVRPVLPRVDVLGRVGLRDRFGHRFDLRERLERVDRRRVAGAVAGLLVLGGSGAGFVLFAPMTRVSQVVVEVPALRSASEASPLDAGAQRDITAAAAVPLGEPLVQVDTEEVARRVAALGRYRAVEVNRAWPDTLRIEVLPRIPVVAVAGSRGVLQLVDEGGVAYEGAARLADVRDAVQRQAAVAAVAALDVQRRAQVRDLEVGSSGEVRMSLGEVEVQWGDASDSRLKAAVVAALVDRAGIRTLDVRAPQHPVSTS